MTYSRDNRIHKKTFKQNDLYFLKTYLYAIYTYIKKKLLLNFTALPNLEVLPTKKVVSFEISTSSLKLSKQSSKLPSVSYSKFSFSLFPTPF